MGCYLITPYWPYKIKLLNDKTIEIIGPSITFTNGNDLQKEIYQNIHIFLIVILDFLFELLFRKNGVFIANSLIMFMNHQSVVANFWANNLDLESRVIFTHHHSHFNPHELFTQFFFHGQFKHYSVLTAQKAVFNLSGFLYNQRSLETKNRSDRHWQIACLLKNESTAISIFPDRDGRQFKGDREFWFRTGAYATSIYWQAPIIDCILQSHKKKLYLFFYKLWPPKICQQSCFSSESYAKWRLENYKLIETFTMECESHYRNCLDKIENNYPEDFPLGHECETKADMFRRRQWNWNSYCEI